MKIFKESDEVTLRLIKNFDGDIDLCVVDENGFEISNGAIAGIQVGDDGKLFLQIYDGFEHKDFKMEKKHILFRY